MLASHRYSCYQDTISVNGTSLADYEYTESERVVRICVVIVSSFQFPTPNWPGLAPGFQTNVRRIRVTPEIAARIQRGDQVSAEEIEAASKKANEEEEVTTTSKSPSKETASSNGGVNTLPLRIIEERDDRIITSQKKKDDPMVNEWLPDSITGPKKKRGKGKKR